MDLESMVVELAQTVKKAARRLATTSTQTKDNALLEAAELLRKQTGSLLSANTKDVARGQENGLSPAMLDRLSLNEARIDAMAKGLEIMVDLPDPVDETLSTWRRPNGLEISQIRVPLGTSISDNAAGVVTVVSSVKYREKRASTLLLLLTLEKVAMRREFVGYGQIWKNPNTVM